MLLKIEYFTKSLKFMHTFFLYRALILYRRRRFINHLLTYLLTYLLTIKLGKAVLCGP